MTLIIRSTQISSMPFQPDGYAWFVTALSALRALAPLGLLHPGPVGLRPLARLAGVSLKSRAI